MGVAFRAPRAPIERPEPPSSRFSFCRRNKPKKLAILDPYTYAFISIKLYNYYLLFINPKPIKVEDIPTNVLKLDNLTYARILESLKFTSKKLTN